MEYMNMGDLRSYLINIRSNNNNYNNNLEIFLNILIQISNGCLYLENNKIVHRDLAARNCLLNKDNNNNLIVKISDLGLARNIYTEEIYEIKNKRKLPLRWMAPESIFDGFFTSKSDVWSFGILASEIFNYGAQPYSGFSNDEIRLALKSKKMPHLTDKCPNEM
jgi:serine/threonine protein kinase